MRMKSLIGKAAAVAALAVLASAPAEAFGWERRGAPAGYGETRVIHHHVYYPRYRHVYHVHAGTDPYAYRYVQPRYYPYYNSGYWRPTHLVKKRRAHYRLPRYYQAWGYPKRSAKSCCVKHTRAHRHW